MEERYVSDIVKAWHQRAEERGRLNVKVLSFCGFASTRAWLSSQRRILTQR